MAGKNQLNIFVRIKDFVKKPLSRVRTSITKTERRVVSATKNMGKSFSILRLVVIGVAVAIIKNLGSAYKEQAVSEIRLRSILKANQKASDEQIQSLKNQANALQKIGVVGDELILTAQSQSATFGVTVEQIKLLTPAILDLVVSEKGLEGTTQDVITVTNKLGIALTTKALGRLAQSGITVEKAQAENFKNLTKEHAVLELINIVQQNIGDRLNKDFGSHRIGQIKQASNAWGDFKQQLGEGFVSTIAALIKGFSALRDEAQKPPERSLWNKWFDNLGLRLEKIVLKFRRISPQNDVRKVISDLTDITVGRFDSTEKIIDKFLTGIQNGTIEMEKVVLKKVLSIISTYQGFNVALSEVNVNIEKVKDGINIYADAEKNLTLGTTTLTSTTEDLTDALEKEEDALKKVTSAKKSTLSADKSLVSIKKTLKKLNQDIASSELDIATRLIVEQELVEEERKQFALDTNLSLKERVFQLADLNKREELINSTIKNQGITEKQLTEARDLENRTQLEKDIVEILQEQKNKEKSLIDTQKEKRSLQNEYIVALRTEIELNKVILQQNIGKNNVARQVSGSSPSDFAFGRSSVTHNRF